MKPACLIGAFGAVSAGLYAAILAVFITSTQMVIDPATREAVYAPWWKLFRSLDGVLVLGFLLAVLGFGWLTWYFARRAFGPSLRGSDKALRRTAFVGR